MIHLRAWIEEKRDMGGNTVFVVYADRPDSEEPKNCAEGSTLEEAISKLSTAGKVL